MTRNDFERIYLDWINNFVSYKTYAEYYGLHDHEALTLIELAKSVSNNQHPEA